MRPDMLTSSYENGPFAAPSLVRLSANISRVQQEVVELFDEYRNPLLRYSLSLGLPIHDAEEVIQEVFLALFRHLRLDRSRRNLRGWLFRVAHNLALKQRLSNQASLQRVGVDARLAEEHQDPSPDPEEQMSTAQRHNRLEAVVQALPEKDQNCLRLRAEGLRYREIATVLGMSLGAVSISLTRSLARLARADGR
jgi:RNA polymerase sigma-70 factor, ECF subfamily